MMKMFLTYDSKAEGYSNIMTAQSTGAMIRSFSDEINRQGADSQVAQHPEDFTLFEIGEYDEQSGVITLYEAKKSLGMGLDFVRNIPSTNLKAAK